MHLESTADPDGRSCSVTEYAAAGPEYAVFELDYATMDTV
jgi:hypothetical protein